MKIVFLDSHPLSLLSDPRQLPSIVAITQWSIDFLANGHRVYVPEITDYELRRELRRSGKLASLQELDGLKNRFRYAPLTTDAMLLAAELWARMRTGGTPTGDPKRLDVDVILAAQALTEGAILGLGTPEIIVATSNVVHIARMVTADLWENIAP